MPLQLAASLVYFPVEVDVMTSLSLGSRLASTIAPALLLAVLGCGGHGSTVNVLEGRITYKGADVSGGTITFYPPTGAPSRLHQADGTYIASDVPPGQVTVTIETASVQNTGKAIMPPGGKSPPGGDAAKYPGGNIPGATKSVQIPPSMPIATGPASSSKSSRATTRKTGI